MKIVPVVKCSDLQRSIRFYTEVLDFERKWPGHEDREMANGVIDLEMLSFTGPCDAFAGTVALLVGRNHLVLVKDKEPFEVRLRNSCPNSQTFTRHSSFGVQYCG